MSNTLIIRNWPEITSKEKEDMMKFFGAKNVGVFVKKRANSTYVIAEFENCDIAQTVMQRLHQKRLFDKRLKVEFANDVTELSSSRNEQIKKDVSQDNTQVEMFESFVNRLNKWALNLQLNLPPPTHLRYQYPPPSAPVLHNIVNLLACVPKFYTQVLHLMNKMNLPSPFEEEFEQISCPTFDSYMEFIKGLIPMPEPEPESEIESELESDRESPSESVFPQRKKLQKMSAKRRKLFQKNPTLPQPVSRSTFNVESIFEKSALDLNKKIVVKVPAQLTIAPEENVPAVTEGFGVIYPTAKEELPLHTAKEYGADDIENKNRCISSEELASNRVSKRDWLVFPVFASYHAGQPSCRLYVKNLAKTVTHEDLEYIYRKYFIEDNCDDIEESSQSIFDIKLMQEGRMKGQAFVTLQNLKLSALALEETNGYILKSRPMVVQYARSARVAEPSTSSTTK